MHRNTPDLEKITKLKPLSPIEYVRTESGVRRKQPKPFAHLANRQRVKARKARARRIRAIQKLEA